jgi:predicted ATPase
MRFSRVALENWRNFTHVDVALQNRAFLVGPNASGKSNFLDALRFLRDLVVPGGGFQKAVNGPPRGGVSRIRCLAARRYSGIALEVELHNGEEPLWRYRLAFGQDNIRRPVITEEKVWRSGEQILDRPEATDRSDPERLRQTHLEQTFANLGFREIADFFASVHYYHLVPQLVRDPERSMERRTDPYGGDFLEQIARIDKRTRDSRLGRILGALKVAVPQLQGLELEKDERGVPHLRGNYEHWRPQGAWLSETDFSDGTLRLMGLLWSLLDGSGPLLLEEPELSLHPGIVHYIPQMMLRAQRTRTARQVLLSTHSSDLLQDEGIAPDEVLLFTPSSEGSTVKVGADIEEVRTLLKAGLTVAEVVMPRTQPENAQQLSMFGD